MRLSFLCRTGTVRSTQGWAAPRPAAAAACGEAAPAPPPGIPQPTGTALTDPGGTRPSCSMRRGARAGLCLPRGREDTPASPQLVSCSQPGLGDTDSAGAGVANLSLLYQNDPVHQGRFFLVTF